MGRKILGTLLALLGVSAAFFYLYYTHANVTLTITDPPPQGSYDPSIQAIYVTFTSIDVHAANAANDSGWHNLSTGATINLLTVLDTSKVLSNAQIPPGKYSELRFVAPTAIITISGINQTYTIPSASQTGLKVVITGGGFQIFGGQTLTVRLDLAFNSTQILNNPTMTLTPIATARVV